MKEFKGTKGEWFVSGGTSIVSMPSQCKITNSVSGWNYDEAKANAQLMATAPRMLEALISIVNYWNTPQRGSINDHINHSLNLAEKVIDEALRK